MGRPKLVSDREVIEGAARVIGRRGPVDFTIREVADEVGLSPAAVMQRFRTKRGLILALEVDSRAALAEAFDAAARENVSPLDAIEDALVRNVRWARSPHEMGNHVAFLAVDLNDPELHAHTLEYFRLFRARVKALLAAAQARGEFPRDADLDETAFLVEVALHGALVAWAIERKGKVGDVVRRALAPALRR